MGICRRSPEDKMRRIGTPIAHLREFLAHCSILDILTIPDHQLGAALVYFTGDDIVSSSFPDLLTRAKVIISSIEACDC